MSCGTVSSQAAVLCAGSITTCGGVVRAALPQAAVSCGQYYHMRRCRAGSITTGGGVVRAVLPQAAVSCGQYYHRRRCRAGSITTGGGVVRAVLPQVVSCDAVSSPGAAARVGQEMGDIKSRDTNDTGGDTKWHSLTLRAYQTESCGSQVRTDGCQRWESFEPWELELLWDNANVWWHKVGSKLPRGPRALSD